MLIHSDYVVVLHKALHNRIGVSRRNERLGVLQRLSQHTASFPIKFTKDVVKQQHGRYRAFFTYDCQLHNLQRQNNTSRLTA